MAQIANPGNTLPKAPTGIQGLDEITGGGLPKGRPTLICGSAGAGKTILGMEFLVRGAIDYGEPGVFMAFEETGEELAQNVRSLGFDLDELAKQKKLVIDFVKVERQEIEETGDYDLEGLFVRIGHAIDTIGAKRVVLDTIESLFSGFSNDAILRAELRRLFRWLKDKGVTAVITAERGTETLSRQGLEEYVSDCVILLDHRVTNQVSTRRIRVVKYRGTVHGTNEYPFLIEEDGVSVLPITSIGLNHEASNERISSGVPGLDAMLGGKGFYRGSSVLVTGPAGTGKSSLAAQVAVATCQRGEKCLYFPFEESPAQIMRNMRSIGIDLQPWLDRGLLRFHAVRATMHGLETHLATIHKLVRAFEPQVVIFDPASTLVHAGETLDAASMLTRLIDFLKLQKVTAMMTSVTAGGDDPEQSNADISSLVDTWMVLRNVESAGERNRVMSVLKSRGMSHSNQIREFRITDNGFELHDAYLGSSGVLTGSMRLAQEAREAAHAVARREQMEARQRERTHRREALEARILAMRKEFEAEEREYEHMRGEDDAREKTLQSDRDAMGRSRQVDKPGNGSAKPHET